MKRYVIRVGFLGTIVVFGWMAVASAQRNGSEPAPINNPLRSSLQPGSGDLTPPPSQAQSPDTIPDAASLDATVETSAAGEASDADGPSLLAPPPSRQPVERRAAAPARSATNDDDRYYNRRPAPRAMSEEEEPARINADVFDAPPAAAPSRAGNPPAARTNPQGMRAIRASAANPTQDNGMAYPNSPHDGNNLANNPPAEGTGQPGARQLEGLQCPQVTIQKLAPAEVQVGRPAVFKTIIRNTGNVAASQVEVRDQIPKGTRLLSTNPKASQSGRGEIVWTVGTLRAGEESAVEMELMPTAEGEIGSVATVHFGADASARTISTRPDVVVQTNAPAQALIGEKINMTITVSNPGSGVATGVILEEHIPAGLQHPAGSELEYNIGVLKPGESKKLELELVAAVAGPVTNLLSVRADGNLRREDRLQMEVVAPKLDLAMDGPKKRYLEREATYQLSVSNPGTAAAQGVELAAYLPQGIKFVSANNQGHYDEATRTVYWRLEQLPTRETGTVELVTLPVEPGQQNIKLRGSAQRLQPIEREQPVVVEGIAAVMFQVADSVDPIEVGGETTYEVHVVNQGSKAASNVQLMAVLPNEMQPLAADGPTRHTVQGNAVIFEGLARLAPKADTVYHVRVKGVRPGDLRLQFKLKTDEMQRPVVKEESTQVYADE